VAGRVQRRTHRFVAAVDRAEIGVDRDGLAAERLDLRGDRGELVEQAVHEEHDGGALAREAERRGPSEAAARTRHKNVFLNVSHWSSMGNRTSESQPTEVPFELGER
jgi:hypothetical protein